MKKYDLIVVGGGFAGFGAAVCAAREGVKTLLIKKIECLIRCRKHKLDFTVYAI